MSIEQLAEESSRHECITHYFNENRRRSEGEELESMGSRLNDIIDELARGPERWPVRNREPRAPISSLIRALLYGRDGEFCRRCGKSGMMTVDHIIPRSAFRPDQLHVADRSDNLQNVCWDCNELKSNFRSGESKRLGVTRRCGWCAAGRSSTIEYDYDEDLPSWEDLYGPGRIWPAYCGKCGHGAPVPSLDWIL